MSKRIQFTISDNEYAQLTIDAAAGNYPNVPELCKNRALKGKSSYSELYKEMLESIKRLPAGTKFYLRDLLESPPPLLLGRWLFEGVANNTIFGVKHLGNNGSDAEQYEKL